MVVNVSNKKWNLRPLVLLKESDQGPYCLPFHLHLLHIWATSWQNQQNDVHLVKTQISLGIRPVWSESSLSAWRKVRFLATYKEHSEDSDQTGWMPRPIWVFAGCTGNFFYLSYSDSYYCMVITLLKLQENYSNFFGRPNFFWFLWHSLYLWHRIIQLRIYRLMSLPTRVSYIMSLL